MKTVLRMVLCCVASLQGSEKYPQQRLEAWHGVSQNPSVRFCLNYASQPGQTNVIFQPAIAKVLYDHSNPGHMLARSGTTFMFPYDQFPQKGKK